MAMKINNLFQQIARQAQEAIEPFQLIARQAQETAERFNTIARRLQYLRELRQREFEHCKYSSPRGCLLIMRIANGFYSKYSHRPYTMKTREDFQQQAFLAMLEQKDSYQEGKPEEFIYKAIRSHYKAIFQEANTKARAIDNNHYSGKVEYINPGLCSINPVVFKEWDIQPQLTDYLVNKCSEPIPDEARGPLTFFSSCDIDYLKGELLQEMLRAVDQLPELERDIIKMYYLQEMRIKDICKLLHISAAREQRTRRAALAKLKNIIFN